MLVFTVRQRIRRAVGQQRLVYRGSHDGHVLVVVFHDKGELALTGLCAGACLYRNGDSRRFSHRKTADSGLGFLWIAVLAMRHEGNDGIRDVLWTLIRHHRGNGVSPTRSVLFVFAMSKLCSGRSVAPTVNGPAWIDRRPRRRTRRRPETGSSGSGLLFRGGIERDRPLFTDGPLPTNCVAFAVCPNVIPSESERRLTVASEAFAPVFSSVTEMVPVSPACTSVDDETTSKSSRSSSISIRAVSVRLCTGFAFES